MPEIVTLPRQLGAVIKVQSPLDKLTETQRATRARIDRVLPSLDTGPLGWTFTLWWTPVNGVMEMMPGTFIARAFEPKDDVVAAALPAGRAVHHLMRGPFDGLPGAWKTLFQWCDREKLQPAGLNLEIYRCVDEELTQQETALYAWLVE